MSDLKTKFGSDASGPAMGRQRYLVVSSDGHAGPSLERSLRPYCPKQYLDRFDAFVEQVRSGAILLGDSQGEELITHADRMIFQTMKTRDAQPGITAGLRSVYECGGHDDPHVRLADMDGEGIAAELILAGGQN